MPLQTAARPIPISSSLDGDWRNIDPKTRGYVEIIIEGKNVHPYGSCHPTACDVGMITAQSFGSNVDSSDISRLVAKKDQGFSQIEITLSLETDGRLRADKFTHFTDGSGRADYSDVGYFYRSNPDRPAALPGLPIQAVARTAPMPNGYDQIKFISARTESGYTVERGKPVPMVVTLAYTLASRDKAILSLSSAQFRDAYHCAGGGELVDAVEREVQKGSGTITIHIVWSGDTGEHSKGRIFGRGSLSFMAMFWEDKNTGDGPNRGERFGLFSLYQDYCAAF